MCNRIDQNSCFQIFHRVGARCSFQTPGSGRFNIQDFRLLSLRVNNFERMSKCWTKVPACKIDNRPHRRQSLSEWLDKILWPRLNKCKALCSRLLLVNCRDKVTVNKSKCFCVQLENSIISDYTFWTLKNQKTFNLF